MIVNRSAVTAGDDERAVFAFRIIDQNADFDRSSFVCGWNAAIYPSRPFLEVLLDEYDDVVLVNQRAHFAAAQQAVRQLRELGSGHPDLAGYEQFNLIAKPSSGAAPKRSPRCSHFSAARRVVHRRTNDCGRRRMVDAVTGKPADLVRRVGQNTLSRGNLIKYATPMANVLRSRERCRRAGRRNHVGRGTGAERRAR
jgi:NAD(P)-dependent dehydrogenase (short-subunit alcohol dehydrogenase family)